MTKRPNLIIFGAGKMGSAMLKGAVAGGWPAAAIQIIESYPSDDLKVFCTANDIALNAGATDVADLLLIAVKPQALDAAIPALLPLVSEKTILVSIMAGKSIADFKTRLPKLTRLVRAMPNTPAAIGRGMTGAYATASLSETERANVDFLLRTTGKLAWVDKEGDIDKVTALSGSGPAYIFHMVEAMALAGEKLGLAPDLAMLLARTTIEGAGELLHQEAGITPEILRKNVTSPGGTTAAALDVLMGKEGLSPLMIQAVAAAHDRAKALSG